MQRLLISFACVGLCLASASSADAGRFRGRHSPTVVLGSVGVAPVGGVGYVAPAGVGFGTTYAAGFGASVPVGFGASYPVGFGASYPVGFGGSYPVGFGASYPMAAGSMGSNMGHGADVGMGNLNNLLQIIDLIKTVRREFEPATPVVNPVDPSLAPKLAELGQKLEKLTSRVELLEARLDEQAPDDSADTDITPLPVPQGAAGADAVAEEESSLGARLSTLEAELKESKARETKILELLEKQM